MQMLLMNNFNALDTATEPRARGAN